jgi:hypothetical protein
MVDSRFFASATAPPTAGFEIGADRLAVVLVVPVALVLDVVVAGLTVDFGLDALVDVAGFRTVEVNVGAPRFSANVSVFAGE